MLPPDGGGTAFRMDANGTVTTLHTFRGPEGAWPKSLIQGRDGFFYGTATLGGQPSISPLNPGVGTIFRMDATGAVTVLYVFPYSIGGGSSQPGPIVQGADGALYGSALGAYGTTAIGGYVYRFDPITGDFRHLHDFVGSDGAIPTGPLFQAGDGFFYGTTNQGGLWNSGVIYKVDVLGHFVLLHSLSPFYPGEGSEPKGGVIQASDGFFYGTTEHGGYGGEIFRMDAAGNFTVLHRFDAYASDGWRPVSGLIEGRDGFLYGTAPIGGQPVTASRYGVVYRMDKAGAVTVVHTFTGPDGTQAAGRARAGRRRRVVRLHGRRRSVRARRAVPRRRRGFRSGPAADSDGTDAQPVRRRRRAELDRDGHAERSRAIRRSGRHALEQQRRPSSPFRRR